MKREIEDNVKFKKNKKEKAEREELKRAEPLKKCPFCGGDAAITFSGAVTNSTWKGYILAKCKICKASSRGYFYHGEPIKIPLDSTIAGFEETERWNLRKVKED